MTTPKKLLYSVCVLLLLTSTALSGIRGPGKYAGVIVYDRWDTCYLISGTYLMYVTEKKKNALRKFRNQSIVIDAEKVYQPMNPGDGLITKFRFVGKAKEKRNLPKVKGIVLTAKQIFSASSQVKFELEVENQGPKTIAVQTSEFAPILFGKKDNNDVFSPSDGLSTALITRDNFGTLEDYESSESITTKDSKGIETISERSFSVRLVDTGSPLASFQLEKGAKRQFVISITLPPGEYDFLFAYGGGVHEGKSLISNLVSFSVA